MNKYNQSKKYTYIDLFAGCGGLSLGLMKAGWKGLFGIEKNTDAFETLKYNLISSSDDLKFAWPDWLPIGTHDITTFAEKYTDELKKLRGTITMIAGGPPCQGFSFRGKRNGNDERNRLFEHYLRIVELISPKIVLLENVHGIAVPFGQNSTPGEKKKKPTVAEEIAGALNELGYKFYSDLVYASKYGVPQSRSRYIMVGVKKHLMVDTKSLDFLNGTVTPFSILNDFRFDFLKTRGLPVQAISIEAAISDLEKQHGEEECKEFPRFKEGKYGPLNGDYQKLMKRNRNGAVASQEIPDSHRFVKHKIQTIENFKKLMECKRGAQISKEDRERLGVGKHDTIPLAADKPCHTLTTLPDDCIHYSEPRIFTVREYSRIQSFPDWFELKGKYTTGGKQRVNECPRYTQVGNAVPPLLGEALGLALIEYINKISPISCLKNNGRELLLAPVGTPVE